MHSDRPDLAGNGLIAAEIWRMKTISKYVDEQNAIFPYCFWRRIWLEFLRVIFERQCIS